MTLNANANNKINKKLIAVLFALYFIALIWVIIFKCNYNATLHIERNKGMSIGERLLFNIVPFKKAIEAIVSGGWIEALALVFNVICFIPFGMLLSVFSSVAMILGLLFLCENKSI